MHKSIKNAKIQWNDSGVPVSTTFDDVYFSNQNGLEESTYVFLQQNSLPNRWLDFRHSQFVIAETGFGTGLNFLVSCQAFLQFIQQQPQSALKQLRFISVEKFPLTLTDIKKAHTLWPQLSGFSNEIMSNFPNTSQGRHQIALFNNQIILDIFFDDVKNALPELLNQEKSIVDCWFLDGFAPSKNPQMWTKELFENMAKLAKEECTLATFTAAGFVRRDLIEAGFSMKKVKGFGTKREMLVGTYKN